MATKRTSKKDETVPEAKQGRCTCGGITEAVGENQRCTECGALYRPQQFALIGIAVPVAKA